MPVTDKRKKTLKELLEAAITLSNNSMGVDLLVFDAAEEKILKALMKGKKKVKKITIRIDPEGCVR